MEAAQRDQMIQKGTVSAAWNLSQMPLLQDNSMPLHQGGPAVSRSDSDSAEGRQKRTFNYFKETVCTEEEALLLSRTREQDIPVIAQEKNIALPDLDLRDRERNPKGRRIERIEMHESAGPSSQRHSSKVSKSSIRRSRTEVQNSQEGDLGKGDKNRVTKHSHDRPHTRPHRRKASDPVPVLPLALPETYPPDRPSLQPPEPSRISSRRAAREARSSLGSSDWLQFAVDIIMWRHVPRSSLIFGMGCFCILSTSAMQDINCSILTVLADIALIYLAAVFFRCSIDRGESSQPLSLINYEISEAAALKVIRAILPAINLMLSKFLHYFSGQPTVTLKVAAALWILSQFGNMMSLWTLARLAFFALFIIPKCYLCYHNQLHGYAQNLLLWGSATWNSFSYKKAVLFAAFAVSWKFFSLSSRIFGVFIMVVTVRAYQQSFGSQREDQSMMTDRDNQSPDANVPVSQHLDLMKI